MQKKVVVALIKTGQEQGFLTQEEILEVFPDAENKIAQLDDFYEILIAKNVDVFETVSAEDILSDEKEKEKFDREICQNLFTTNQRSKKDPPKKNGTRIEREKSEG